jgi:dihydrofolate reductase
MVIQLVGGAKLAAVVIEADLVDEYRLNIVPIIVGGGKSFFQSQSSRHKLRHLQTKVLNSGTMIVRYSTLE